MPTQTDTASHRKSFLDRLIHKLDRIALDARPSSPKKPAAQHAHPLPAVHRHSHSYQRPPAQSSTWYAPQPLLPAPTTTPSDRPSLSSPIRIPLPSPASPAPPVAPCLSPIRKPIAFPIPHPTGRRYSPSLGHTNHPVHPTDAQANNSNSHSKNKASITIDLTCSSSSSESLHAGLPSANHAEAAKRTGHGRGRKADGPDASKVATPVKPDVDASSALQTPTKSPGAQASASSTPGRPSTERCAGTTKQGKPCSRKPMKTIGGAHDTKINVAESLDDLDDLLALSATPSGHPVDVVPRFCFQHYHKFQSQSGSYFAHSQWVEYSDWIDEKLPDAVKMALKMEMTKGPSEKDRSERGYLYCHEMKPAGGMMKAQTRTTTHIKVGRSIHPVARLGEWAKQCPSREPIVRGFFPAAPPAASSSPCYLNGAQECAPHGARFHRKWERLVLLELAGWATLQLPHNNNNNSTRKLPCIDCAKIHTEIFLLPLGSYESLVCPLIERWQRWCAFAYL